MIKANVILENSDWEKKITNPKKYIQKKLNILSKMSKNKKKILKFTLLLTNDKKMKNLNKKFRKKNKSTDVLSFPFNDKYSNNSYIGDIAVSYEIINSRSKKNIFIKEFDKVWIHGFLHLIGYDHVKNKDYIKMNKIEKRILNFI